MDPISAIVAALIAGATEAADIQAELLQSAS